MSIVLPCAFEGNFAVQTVQAIWDHTIHHRVKEILVVDDGSQPPLVGEFPSRLLSGEPGVAPVKIVRHERTMGLIAAKKAGGDVAKGDVIVFLDCHVSPRRGWEEAILRQMRRAGDHRTVVVPTITSLNPDTWEEIPNGPAGKSCYILWNADFTWLPRPGRDVPLMSGGLLAISRRWWEETGGYDEHMVAWGGENIDQSLRVWLCGGRIEVAEGAYVAHMWRDPANPKTALRYPIPTRDVMRNKARAVSAWFGEFRDKIFTFPEYEVFVKGEESIGDMSNFDSLRSRLKCAPFSSYIARFSNVYLDTGLIPQEVFQLRELSTGLCLERIHKEKSPHGITLSPCTGGEDGKPVAELQMWHPGNQDRSNGDKCCSGIINWNFLQCLDAPAKASQVRTFDCEISGSSANQFFSLKDFNSALQLQWQGGNGCVAPMKPKAADAGLLPTGGCTAFVQAEGTKVVHVGLDGQETAPRDFKLKVSSQEHPQGLCAIAAGIDQAESITGLQLQFETCQPEELQQVLHATPMLHGLQIRVGESDYCLDAAGGGALLVYPCYEESATNMNQVWHIRDHLLVWNGPRRDGPPVKHCVNMMKQKPKPDDATKGQPMMRTCASKPGQKLQRGPPRQDGTFFLLTVDGSRCLRQGDFQKTAMGACDDGALWRVLTGKDQVQHVTTGWCMEEDPETAGLRIAPCHTPRALNRYQMYEILDKQQWVKRKQEWGDNGRRRWFEKCVDFEPTPSIDVSVQRCAAVHGRGVRWERYQAHPPMERSLWDRAVKPAPGEPELGAQASRGFW